MTTETRNVTEPTPHRFLLSALISLVMLFFLSGCADTVSFQQAGNIEPVGFWYGLWHGLILPFAWFISLFSDSTSIYAIYNNGGWYDFGFFLGVGFIGGGSSAASQR